MRKNKKKSRISEADKELARRTARLSLRNIAQGFEIDCENLCSIADLLETVYPEDEIAFGNRRPPEYKAVVNVAGSLLDAIRCVDNLLNK